MMATPHEQATWRLLDPTVMSPPAQAFYENLSSRIVGQGRAVKALVGLYQLYLAGMTTPHRPIGTLLFLGPTGTGKTRVVEAAAEVLFGDPYAMIKVDCGEFQHSHEIAKLIGSPPGYLGHRETEPAFTQERLDRFQTPENQFTFVLFDEIEKASDSLWYLLLGILDKASLTLGDNRKVDFSRCIICLTSNLGAKEMEDLMSGSIGFSPPGARSEGHTSTDEKIYRTALAAARRKFSPEFMNRIDKTVVFRPLREVELVQVLELELKQVYERLTRRFARPLDLSYTSAAKQFLLEEGRDYRYGARHLKRAIERYVVFPMANLIATGQVTGGDELLVDVDAVDHRLNFTKIKEAPAPAPRVSVANRRSQSSSFLSQPALAP